MVVFYYFRSNVILQNLLTGIWSVNGTPKTVKIRYEGRNASHLDFLYTNHSYKENLATTVGISVKVQFQNKMVIA